MLSGKMLISDVVLKFVWENASKFRSPRRKGYKLYTKNQDKVSFNTLVNTSSKENLTALRIRISMNRAVQAFPRSSLNQQISRKESQKKSSRGEVFLEISQNSQENTRARFSFLIKWQVCLQLYLKRDSGAGVFLLIL